MSDLYIGEHPIDMTPDEARDAILRMERVAQNVDAKVAAMNEKTQLADLRAKLDVAREALTEIASGQDRHDFGELSGHDCQRMARHALATIGDGDAENN